MSRYTLTWRLIYRFSYVSLIMEAGDRYQRGVGVVFWCWCCCFWGRGEGETWGSEVGRAGERGESKGEEAWSSRTWVLKNIVILFTPRFPSLLRAVDILHGELSELGHWEPPRHGPKCHAPTPLHDPRLLLNTCSARQDAGGGGKRVH